MYRVEELAMILDPHFRSPLDLLKEEKLVRKEVQTLNDLESVELDNYI